MNEQIELLKGLRAVREFSSEPVSDESLAQILEVARWTGTASNLQAWELIVVRERESLRALSECGIGHLATAAVGLVIVSPGANPELEAFDDGRISERIMLAARAEGLASGVGWFKNGGRARARAMLGAPPNSTLRTAVSIGHAEVGAEHGRKRKSLAEFVHQGRY
ncbi:MAG: nitroreductase family protein [Candidatus Dormibacteraceae bacterium]